MERQIGCVFFLVVLLKMANAGTVDIPHMKLNQFFNQTATGYFREVWGETEILRVPSASYQDDLTKRLRLDTGVPGQASWQSSTFYLADKTYAVSVTDGKISCKLIPDFTYNLLNNHYGPDYLSYVGRHNLQEFGDNQIADVYAGQALDIDGPLDTVMYMSPTNGEYMGLIQMGSIQSNLSFWEVWLDKTSPTIPDSSVFTLPAECDHPDTTEMFWDTWNPDGTPKLPKTIA